MVHHPDRAAQVLEATVEPEDPSQWYEVPDVFSFLVRQAARLPEGRRRGALAELSGTLERLIRDKRPRYFNFPQWVVGTIIAASEPDSALALYNTLRERGHYLSENTKLHVGSRLAKDMRFRPLAFELLEELVRKDGLSVDDRRCAALATSLISLPDGWEEGREPPERLRTLHDLYQRILSLGFTTNQVIHASMMRTLCLNGQLDLAWNIYDFMRAEGVPTDLYVYSILLHGAKLAGSMDSTLRVVQEASVGDLQNRIVWNDLIDTVLVAANNESIAKPGRPLPVFCSMLHIYAKFFTLESLQRLIPEDLSTLLTAPALRGLEDCEWGPKLAMLLDKLPVSEPSNRVTPHADTLNIMLLGYLRSFPVAQPILDFYSHFRSLLRRGDRLAISILQEGTVPYDGVIQAVSRFPGMLNVAVDIVAGMIEDAAASAAALKEQRTLPPSDKAEGSSSPFVHPRPSVHTWSILLQAFAKMKGVQEGWRILEIMRKHGVKPNRVTWNMLIDASARSHDAKLTMEAFTHLEKEGYVPDTYTMRGLSRLVDNEDALNRLDQLMEQSESIKSTQAAPDKTQELISQWNNARAAKVLARRPRKKQLTPRPRRRRLRERPQEMPAGESESGDQAEQKDSWAGTPLVLDKTDKAGEKPRRRKKSKGEQATLPTPRTRDQASVDSYRQLYKELLPGVTHGAPQDSQKGEEGTTPGRGEAEEDREGRAAGEATTSSTPLG
ncbi:uncharacterized protein THITE_2106504 [Thermothielavioides terrestris NRRL 8126]|uniref:Pentacotripeptide-repeat region of PRORP domain-containing protein n=1 Tax=Thermothielavioides terrestris (strain ATCC 38088 / NRRL 8126) TaxID=578455 RepID=G2QQI3_THETT|nr:uncharacterized protein THITE_2106504 [Thermothielavioides terrestris NRRL 8126]AEO62393.1 hypothetical protein THITE_2106504 [Thermothielavioides terrestris NRRL 8126]